MSDVVRKFAKKEREEGRAEGRAEEKRNFAKFMAMKNFEDKEIMECTGLPIEEVRAIRQNPEV